MTESPADSADLLRRARALSEGGTPAAVITIVRGDGLGRRLMATAERVEGTLGDSQLDRDSVSLARAALGDGRPGIYPLSPNVDVFVDVFPVRRLLLLIGAVHVAQAIVRLAEPLGFRIVVVDARESLATRDRFPTVDGLIVAWPDEALEEIAVNEASSIVILTHDPKFDEPAILGALKTDAGYIGAIGSRKTNHERRDRMLEAGATEEQLERVHAPIGLDIGGSSPEEMAISILAEIISVRYGRSGGSLRSTAGRIRAEGN